MILAYIHQYKDRFGVEPICRVLPWHVREHAMPIAPGTYYAWRRRPVSEQVLREAHLVNVVIDLH